ncbi:GGDEF domain-containing protein [Shewanella colwelliana]|uniref:GGDEF domain-containing protein n=1 Tax=Shewanella colwelliana TaxID=23 RepID=UPI0022AF37EC|nr:GGDEF domain-containing protein [Shewanella colwelliana]MCZ4338288.1 GGDEF domain-containing protein [Shewanella colwelliana]
MTAVAVFIVLIGLMGLLGSLIPTYQICHQKQAGHRGWHLLLAMIGMFILGYLGFLWMLMHRNTASLEMVVAAVFSAGGGFVWLVVKMSQETILTLQNTLKEKHYQAYHDLLTDLPNRHQLYEKMDQLSQNENNHFGFLMMDLNDFKMINDNLGHDAGDKVLQIIAHRIRTVTPMQALAVRLGGDEFAIVLPSASSEQAKNLAVSIQQQIMHDIMCEGHRLAVGISIGIAHYPKDGEDRKTLMKNADIAMYTAKRNGNAYETYSSKDTI